MSFMRKAVLPVNVNERTRKLINKCDDVIELAEYPIRGGLGNYTLAFKGTLRWSDKNLYMINIDPKITLVWLKILNSSIFTPKSGRES